jgi:hypothetical protein
MPPSSLKDNLKMVFGAVGHPEIGELVDKFDFSKVLYPSPSNFILLKPDLFHANI